MWFREGICFNNPEGSSWEEVPVPGEVVQISSGPGDLVWAVLWEGQFIVREGIGRDCPKGTVLDKIGLFLLSYINYLCKQHIPPTAGTSWMTVDSPNPHVGATHVAVGSNVVWALTKDNKVRNFSIEQKNIIQNP